MTMQSREEDLKKIVKDEDNSYMSLCRENYITPTTNILQIHLHDCNEKPLQDDFYPNI